MSEYKDNKGALHRSNVVIGFFLTVIVALAGYAVWVVEQQKEFIKIQTQYGGVEEWRQLWIDDRKAMFQTLSDKVDKLDDRVRVLEKQYNER